MERAVVGPTVKSTEKKFERVVKFLYAAGLVVMGFRAIYKYVETVVGKKFGTNTWFWRKLLKITLL